MQLSSAGTVSHLREALLPHFGEPGRAVAQRCMPIPPPCSRLEYSPTIWAHAALQMPEAPHSLSQLLSVIRQFLSGVGEVVRPPYVLPGEKKNKKGSAGAPRAIGAGLRRGAPLTS